MASVVAATALVTGLDLLVLLLLLHVWLVVVGLAVWNDDARTGVAWVDQRIHLGNRLYGGLMLLAVVLTWLPFALGQYPIGPNNPFGRSRTALVPITAGGLLIGAGCYFLGGALTNCRSYVSIRLTDTVDAAAVESGRVQVSGQVEPIGPPLESPLSGTDAVCYQLSATRVASDEAFDSDGEDETAAAAGGRPSLLDETVRLADERRPFWLRDDTGRVAVDPTAAELRLERTASRAVAGDERPPESLATVLHEGDDLEAPDRDRIYHETTLEPGQTVSVVGVAVEHTDAVTAATDGADGPAAATAGDDRRMTATAGDEGTTATVDGDDELPGARQEYDGSTITAGETATEFVVAPGCEDGVDRHYLVTILGCALATIVLTGSGFGILWLLAGH